MSGDVLRARQRILDTFPSDLVRVIAAWPHLDPQTRRDILNLADRAPKPSPRDKS